MNKKQRIADLDKHIADLERRVELLEQGQVIIRQPYPPHNYYWTSHSNPNISLADTVHICESVVDVR